MNPKSLLHIPVVTAGLASAGGLRLPDDTCVRSVPTDVAADPGSS